MKTFMAKNEDMERAWHLIDANGKVISSKNMKIGTSSLRRSAQIKAKYPKAKIIVTVIGNQGFIFGRGNQQFSPAVIRKVGLDNIILIATISKLEKTEKLRVDTGDPELDKELQGFVRVITSYHEDLLMRIEE